MMAISCFLFGCEIKQLSTYKIVTEIITLIMVQWLFFFSLSNTGCVVHISKRILISNENNYPIGT